MNYKTIFTCALLLSFSMQIGAQNKHTGVPPEVSPMPMKPEMTEIWEPEVSVVTPAKTLGDAPSDAIILFDGSSLDQWVSQKDNSQTAPWKIIDNNYFEVVPGSGGISTKMKFGDCQIHIEFSAPDVVEGHSQGRGNSGLFLQNRLDAKAKITVLHNGVLVQNNVEINGNTYYVGLHNYPSAHGDDVLSLQDHGNKTQFRNIWVRPL